MRAFRRSPTSKIGHGDSPTRTAARSALGRLRCRCRAAAGPGPDV